MTPSCAPSTTVAEYLFERLRQLGIEHVFGVPGDFSLALLDALEEAGSPRWVGCASELGAAYAADGYARARGMGALATTFGVGELSAANGVAGAMAEDVGVLHVVGAPSIAAMAAGAPLHHTLADGDHWRFARMAAEITHHQVHVGHDAPGADIDRALTVLLASRRPVYLLLPQDVVTVRVDAEPLRTPLLVPSPAAPTLSDARELIRDFVRSFPDAVAVLGHLVARWHLEEDLARLLRTTGATSAALPNSKSVVAETTPRYVGVFNGKLSSTRIQEVVQSPRGRILIGCTLADTTTGGLSHDFPTATTLVLSRDDVHWGGRAVSGVPFAELVALLSAEWITARDGCRTPSPQVPYEPPLGPWAPVDGEDGATAPLTQDELWSVVAAELPGGMRLFADTGTAHYGALDIALPPGTVFEPATVWSSIGYSLPASLGAALADPGRRCVAVLGDGAAQMVAQELGLVARAGLNPVVLLVNNGGYTVERVIRGPAAAYNDIVGWDWQALPGALGVDEGAMSRSIVRDAASLVAALRAALADDGRAHLLEVVTGVLDTPPTLTTMAAMLRARIAREQPRGHEPADDTKDVSTSATVR